MGFLTNKQEKAPEHKQKAIWIVAGVLGSIAIPVIFGDTIKRTYNGAIGSVTGNKDAVLNAVCPADKPLPVILGITTVRGIDNKDENTIKFGCVNPDQISHPDVLSIGAGGANVKNAFDNRITITGDRGHFYIDSLKVTNSPIEPASTVLWSKADGIDSIQIIPAN